MSPTISITIIWITLNLFGIYQGSRVQINLQDKSELGSKLKLICGSRMRKSLVKAGEDILWEGYKFGLTEQKEAASNSGHITIPDMKLNSNRLKCLLKTLKSGKIANNSKEEFRKQRDLAGVTSEVSGIKLSTEHRSRKQRELAGTIQTEKGNCPPGHRIDQDRCFPCFPGSYTSGQETECFLCPKDFYVSKEGADACWPCPGGKKTLKEGADSEDACIDTANNFHKDTRFSAVWILLIILLLMFILFSWIVIIFLLMRVCFDRTSRRSMEGKVEEGVSRKISRTALKSLELRCDSEKFEGRQRHSHHKRLPSNRRLLKFDVDIKGSATFTDKNSSSIEDCNITECKYTSNIENEKNTEQLKNSVQPNSNKSKTSHLNDDIDLNYSKNVWKKGDSNSVFCVGSQLTNADEKTVHSSNISVKQSSCAAEFEVVNSCKAIRETLQNLELSQITLDDHNPTSFKNVNEIEKKLKQPPPIEIEAESSIEQKSGSSFHPFQKQQVNEREFFSNQDLVSKRDEETTGLQLPNSKAFSPLTKNGDCCITIDPSQEILSHSQPAYNEVHRNSLMFNKINLTKPTSCPIHLDSESHVEIVLIHLPS